MNFLDREMEDKPKKGRKKRFCQGMCGMTHVDFLYTHYDKITQEAVWMCDECHRKICDFDNPNKSFKGKVLSSLQANL